MLEAKLAFSCSFQKTLLFLRDDDSSWQDQETLPEPKRALDMRWPGAKTLSHGDAPFWTTTS